MPCNNCCSEHCPDYDPSKDPQVNEHNSPVFGVKLAKLEMTCSACPSQWDAWSVDGEYYYIRYRHGGFSVAKGHVRNYIFSLDHGDGYDGCMSTEEMLKLTGFVVDSGTEVK